MKDEDTVEKQPVTVEEEIASLLAAGELEEVEDEPVQTDEPEPEEDGGPEAKVPEPGVDDDEDRPDEPEGIGVDEVENDEGQDDEDLPEPETDTDKLEAPYHWSEPDKEAFNEQPKGAQEYILKRHKEMEGHFTRKNQEMADTQRQFDAMRDALTPYEQEFAQSGLDYAGAVRQLASWHNALKSGGKAAVLQLASSYGIDLDADDEYVDPAMRQTQAQLAEIKAQLARNTAEAQQARRAELAAEIKNFQTATDSEGKILHPHFDALETDIAQLFEAGMCSSLEEGYKKALRLRDDLAAPKPRTAVKGIDPAEKVKQAKRAATGVKSSGAVGKKDRGKMTLEEEIASHFQS